MPGLLKESPSFSLIFTHPVEFPPGHHGVSQREARLVRDPAVWDELVRAHAHGGFMQSAGWGRFRRHFGWPPLLFFLLFLQLEPIFLLETLTRKD